MSPVSASHLRRACAIAGALALTASLAACGGGSTSSSSGSPEGALEVSTSFYPVEYLAKTIGGDHVTVTSVTPTNVEPHDYELAPADVTALNEADVIAYVAGFQPSMDDAVAQASGPAVVELSASVDLTHHDGVEEEHEDGEGAHDDAGAGEAADPHFWLDPTRMRSAATAIEAALATADPDHASDYEANLATLTTSLDGLDSSYRTGLAQCRRTTLVTSHAAFGYLAEAYGLTQVSISGVDPDSEPSPADLAGVKKVVQDTGTTTIFTEELVSPATAQTVADETGATTAVLSPIESAPSGGDYASAMTTNLEALRTALSCQ